MTTASNPSDSNPSGTNPATPPKKGLTALGYPGLLLGITVLLSTSLLAVGHLSTRDAIAERQAEDLNASLNQVLPATLRDNDLLQAPLDLEDPQGDRVRVYRAEQQQRISAVAFGITAPDGYGGPIRMIMGVAADGGLLGVRVLSHTETPGLGDKIETAKSDWILSFDGHSLQNLTDKNWAVKKDGGQFDQFTGATVTPRAVVNAVRRGLQFYRQQQTSLLTPAVSDSQAPAASAAAAPATTANPVNGPDGEST